MSMSDSLYACDIQLEANEQMSEEEEKEYRRSRQYMYLGTLDLAEEEEEEGESSAHSVQEQDMYGSNIELGEEEEEGGGGGEKEQEQEQEDAVSFNERLQRIIDKDPQLTSYASLKEAASVLREFCEVAEIYGRIIIAEKGLPAEKKTVKPISGKGIAGGEKYIVSGILFKYSLDPCLSGGRYLFGGTKPDQESARKAAGRELLGLTSVYSCGSSIRLAPTLIIDWLGFRLIAVALLPINGDTLAYGSGDGGKTVRWDEGLHEKFVALGDDLNLRQHEVGMEGVQIVGPGDIEGHKGLDGRDYVIDMGRLMPPEYPKHLRGRKWNPREVFVRLLRPELVRNFDVPLCSDVFTNWNRNSLLKDEHEEDARAVAAMLHDVLVPQVAQKLEKMWLSGSESLDVAKVLHSAGVNLRWLGRVCSFVKETTLRRFLLAEGVSRAIKNLFWEDVREMVGVARSASTERYVELAVTFLNNTLMADVTAPFWRKVRTKTEDCFYEMPLDLFESLDRRLVLHLFLQKANIKLKKRTKEALGVSGDLLFLRTDIKALALTSRRFHLIEFADGIRRLLPATREQDPATRVRLLKDSLQHFRLACQRAVQSVLSHVGLGTALLLLAVDSRVAGEKDFLELAVEAEEVLMMATTMPCSKPLLCIWNNLTLALKFLLAQDISDRSYIKGLMKRKSLAVSVLDDGELERGTGIESMLIIDPQKFVDSNQLNFSKLRVSGTSPRPSNLNRSLRKLVVRDKKDGDKTRVRLHSACVLKKTGQGYKGVWLVVVADRGNLYLAELQRSQSPLLESDMEPLKDCTVEQLPQTDKAKARYFCFQVAIVKPESAYSTVYRVKTLKELNEFVTAIGQAAGAKVITLDKPQQIEEEEMLRQVGRVLLEKVKIKDRRWRLRVFKQCFVASQAVDVLIQEGYAATRPEAVSIGNKLVALGVICHVVDEHQFKDASLFFKAAKKE